MVVGCLCHRTAKFSDHRHYIRGEIMFLISFLISQEQVTQASCDSIDWRPFWEVTTLPSLMVICLMQV